MTVNFQLPAEVVQNLSQSFAGPNVCEIMANNYEVIFNTQQDIVHILYFLAFLFLGLTLFNVYLMKRGAAHDTKKSIRIENGVGNQGEGSEGSKQEPLH